MRHARTRPGRVPTPAPCSVALPATFPGALPAALLAVFLAIFLTGGCAAANRAGAVTEPASHTVSAINASPMSIDGVLVRYTDLSGLRLRNITLKNTAFFGCFGKDIDFRNVIFENCRFINTRFTGGVMENVTFKGGLFTCENDRDNLDKRSSFSRTVFNGVAFDGVSMDNFIMDVEDSSIILRNMHAIRALEPLIKGKNISLTIEDCVFLRIPAITEISGKSSLLVRDTTFSLSNMGKSVFERVLFERCITYGGAVYTPPPKR